MNNAQNIWFAGFLNQLKQGGWCDVFSIHGWNMAPTTSLTALNIDRTHKSAAEFTTLSEQAITPGLPQHSLLYHCLMHPSVTDDEISYWPSLEDIDNLENYIYQLALLNTSDALSGVNVSKLVPVTMAYEYRVTARTPHKKHADLIFSRAGVGRVGNEAIQYDPKRRCFNTEPDEFGLGTRVQPARYGVFLCEKVKGAEGLKLQGNSQKGDRSRTFYRPVIKVFDDISILGKTLSLSFEEFHQNDKLSRMVSEGGLNVSKRFNIDKPPFLYRSDRENFVGAQHLSGSVVIWRLPVNLCQIAKQHDEIVTFTVPKEDFVGVKKSLSSVLPVFPNNRRYTSLRVGQQLGWVAADYLLNLLPGSKRAFLSPRRAGEFTNIRHIVNEHGEIEDLNLKPAGDFKAILAAGGYEAVMYEDPISEGYVHAKITNLDEDSIYSKPAYSLMTAPDFMPRVGNIDIYQYRDNFVIGEPRALCEGRLPANLRLKDSTTGEHVFSAKDNAIMSICALETMQQRVSDSGEHYNNTHFMTDEASDVFAPGWDVTYSRESIFSSPYYHTSGLGSPFLEDVKLCAAANGMWPAASPDAARTFKRSTRTALPLTDIEIGLSPHSTLGAKLSSTEAHTFGWDGEFGPYIEHTSAVETGYCINYASIERSDYISNFNESRFDFSKLRHINRVEAEQRLHDLKCVNDLLLAGTALSKSEYWLVSFSKVKKGESPNRYVNAPSELIKSAELHKRLLTHSDDGYFFIFAQYDQSSKRIEGVTKRRIQPVNEFVFVRTSTQQAPSIVRYHNTGKMPEDMSAKVADHATHQVT